MSETGVVKFACECDFRELAPFPGLEETNAARQELRALGLLGVGEDGVGFGNVSLRNGWTNSFYIIHRNRILNFLFQRSSNG